MQIVFIGANNPETIRVVNACRSADGEFEVIGFLDSDPEKINRDFYGYPVLGNLEFARELDLDQVRFVNLITRDTPTRYLTSKIVQQAGGVFANMVHPDVKLEMVSLGLGNYIQDRVVLQAGVGIGNNSSIHIGTLVGHETQIGNSVFIAHGCNLSGCLDIQDGVFMGTGVSITPRVTIGKWSIIGAGSVVIKDIPPYSVAVGNPARVIKTIEPLYDSGDLNSFN